MGLRDMQPPNAALCEEQQFKISKHLHCVSSNNTKSFADFLAHQGAKKEQPVYKRERERIEHEHVVHVAHEHHVPLPNAASHHHPGSANAG